MIDHAKLHRAQRRWLRRHAAIDDFPREVAGPGFTHRGAAQERSKETRADKRRWRRRCARARHTKHSQRAMLCFRPVPFGEGYALGLYDDDSGYPVITRAPWLRGARMVGTAEIPI